MAVDPAAEGFSPLLNSDDDAQGAGGDGRELLGTLLVDRRPLSVSVFSFCALWVSRAQPFTGHVGKLYGTQAGGDLPALFAYTSRLLPFLLSGKGLRTRDSKGTETKNRNGKRLSIRK